MLLHIMYTKNIKNSNIFLPSSLHPPGVDISYVYKSDFWANKLGQN